MVQYDLDQRPIFQPELDGVEERLVPQHPATEGVASGSFTGERIAEISRIFDTSFPTRTK
jgi:hypothetical protein